MAPTTLLQECISSVSARAKEDSTINGAELMLLCISDLVLVLEKSNDAYLQSMHRWLYIFSSASIFFMQTGFAMIAAGSVRKKNLMNTMLKSLLDACVTALMFFAVGYAFAFGGTTLSSVSYSSAGSNGLVDETTSSSTTTTTWIGTTNFFGTGSDFNITFWFFQYTLCASCVTLVAGTLAERCQMGAYLWYCVFLAGFVYPISAHTLWSKNGYLSPSNSANLYRGIGVIDFAGGGVVHVAGGCIALIAAKILGPRVGRFTDINGNKLDKPAEIQGHSIALQTLGILVLWFAWFGFNGGSALLLTRNTRSYGQIAARAVTNTVLSGAFGCISTLFLNMTCSYRKSGDEKHLVFDLVMAMNGAMSGLVGVTAACGTIETWSAPIIGFLSGFVYFYGQQVLDYLHIDDVVKGIPVHLFTGIWGMIATGLFASPTAMNDAYGTDSYVGLFYEFGRGNVNGVLFTNQLIGILFLLIWNTCTMTPLFLLLMYVGKFRSDGMEEVAGLDIRYHGVVTNTTTTNNNNNNSDNNNQIHPPQVGEKVEVVEKTQDVAVLELERYKEEQRQQQLSLQPVM